MAPIMRGDYSLACMELSSMAHLRPEYEEKFNDLEKLKAMAVKYVEHFKQLEIDFGRSGITSKWVIMAENAANEAQNAFVEAVKDLKEFVAKEEEEEADAPLDVVN